MLMVGLFKQVPGQNSGDSFDVLVCGQTGVYLMPVTEEASMGIARFSRPGCPMGVEGEVVIEGEVPVMKAVKVHTVHK